MPVCSAASVAVAGLCTAVPILGLCIYVMYMVVLGLLAIWLAVVLGVGHLENRASVRRLWEEWKEMNSFVLGRLVSLVC